MFYKHLADYYHHVFPAKDKAEFLNSIFKSPSKLLDIGCSDGRVALILSDLGHDLTGIDLSEDMVRVANKVSENGEKFSVKLMDLLEVDQQFSSVFEGVYCLGNTLVHLKNEEEIQKALNRIYKTIQPKGKLVIQILNYDYIYSKKITELPYISNEILSFKRDYVLSENQVFFNITLTLNATNQSFKSQTYLYPIRKAALDELITKAGFKILNHYGSYNGKPFHSNDMTLIVIAKR